MSSEFTSNSYRSFSVWKRLGGGRLARYRCFEVLETGKFCVQSCDFYRTPCERSDIDHLDSQFLELLAEEAPDVRHGSFSTLEEAISDHDQNFA